MRLSFFTINCHSDNVNYKDIQTVFDILVEKGIVAEVLASTTYVKHAFSEQDTFYIFPLLNQSGISGIIFFSFVIDPVGFDMAQKS